MIVMALTSTEKQHEQCKISGDILCAMEAQSNEEQCGIPPNFPVIAAHMP